MLDHEPNHCSVCAKSLHARPTMVEYNCLGCGRVVHLWCLDVGRNSISKGYICKECSREWNEGT